MISIRVTIGYSVRCNDARAGALVDISACDPVSATSYILFVHLCADGRCAR